MEFIIDFISNNVMEIISSILSLSAIIVAVVTWKATQSGSKKITEKTMNKKFF